MKPNLTETVGLLAIWTTLAVLLLGCEIDDHIGTTQDDAPVLTVTADARGDVTMADVYPGMLSFELLPTMAAAPDCTVLVTNVIDGLFGRRCWEAGTYGVMLDDRPHSVVIRSSAPVEAPDVVRLRLWQW